jgi:hypothetical protein
MVLVMQLIIIDRFLGHDTWRMYAKLFRGVWAASAFKVGDIIRVVLHVWCIVGGLW